MTTGNNLSPYPYFGGKRTVAADIWKRLGDCRNFIDPFLGSNAVMLNRPGWDWESGEWHDGANRIETVNDADGYVSNFWRAIAADPEQTAHYADWPVNENDLHARHSWLLAQKDGLAPRLEGDPEWFDAKIAGWWAWGICCWIGSGWCSGQGPWHAEDGMLVNGNAQGVNRQLPHLGNAGKGVNRKRVHLSGERGVARPGAALYQWFDALSARMRRVRVCCGDWSRITGPSPTTELGMTAVILDPPYSGAMRDKDLYTTDSNDVSTSVREWAIANGDNPLLRIALCGYEGEHEMPGTWETYRWKAQGGYGGQGDGRGRANRDLEVVWFSPNCLKVDRPTQGEWTL